MSGRRAYAATAPRPTGRARRPGSRARRAVAALGTAALMGAVALALGATREPHAAAAAGPARTATRPAPGTTASVLPTPGASPSAGFIAPARWVTLPTAAGADGQLPVGFPHTAPGAAALGAAIVQFGWTTDLSQARTVAALYAAPADQGAALTNAAELAGNLAAKLGGTPESLPAGAGVQASIVGVALHSVDADTELVDLLVAVVYYPAGAPPSAPRYTALSAVFTWLADPGDWRYTLAPADAPPAADPPGTAAFNADGWSAIQTAGA